MPTEIDVETQEGAIEEVEAAGAIKADAETTAIVLAVEKKQLSSLRLVEAALFLSNKTMTLKGLGEIAGVGEKRAAELVAELQNEYTEREGAVEIVSSDGKAGMQVKNDYLSDVAKLSKEAELSRKATKILALVAKKKQLLQSELKNYFRGEIYAYVSELREMGYLESTHKGNTRLLKPTQKFYDSFQIG
ncbi:MAG: SMC-Scp complex subunit ScpB [Candidatus Micrarchaeota archaeon]